MKYIVGARVRIDLMRRDARIRTGLNLCTERNENVKAVNCSVFVNDGLQFGTKA
jgi:hypothetical protein